MKIKQILTLVVGITSMVLTSLTWADARGGGGAGGFSGGGFHGGGGFGGGHFGGVTRGSNGGFRAGAPHYALPPGHFSHILPGHAFSSAALRQSRLAQSARAGTTFNRPSDRGATNRSVPANIARNNNAASRGTRSSQAFAQRALNGRTDHIAERHDTNWHRDWDHRHVHFHNGRFFVFEDGFWYGLDDGFFPWDYLPYYADDYYPYDYYAEVAPNDTPAPVYTNTPSPDPMVQAAQAQLNKEGYYGGPADGIFGPSTRDAVARYQMANQLNVTGSLSPDTLQALQLPQGNQS